MYPKVLKRVESHHSKITTLTTIRLSIILPPMTKEALRERIDAAPFRPFSVRLTDGRQCAVPAADYASLSPNGRLLLIYTAAGDGVKILDVSLIKELEAAET